MSLKEAVLGGALWRPGQNLSKPKIARMTASDRRRERAWQGVEAWSGFPADRQPRPLVLLFPGVSSGGFPDRQKKRAFLCGAIEAAPGFPDSLLRALRSLRTPTEYDGPPVVAAAATLASTQYWTDRGRLQLPAWEVRAIGVPEPICVLDPPL